MRLFIAEKPSLARALAEALPGPRQRSTTHITCGEGNVVTWCLGHILHAAPPEAYDPDHKAWRLEPLPITPRDWKLEVTAPELLRAIQSLLKKASSVVHAGDPDREGQLLVDEVLQFLGYRGPILRLLVRDLRPEAVRQELGRLEPNAKFRSLSESALARQRADWLYGINMTRLYTLLGRAAGYDGVLSVGRVQTPLLGLVVARDRAIAAFQPAAYFVLRATLRTSQGETFRARWRPGPSARAFLDEDERLVHADFAEAVRRRVQGQPGRVTAYAEDTKSEPPPRPYALADLQIDAARRLGLRAQAVLDVCQSLYEKRLTTYPRSDCAYLPEGQHAQASAVVAQIARQAPALAPAIAGADLARRSRAWNDARVTAHHALIPTPSGGASATGLSEAEHAVYALIARRYLAQFYPAFEFLETELTLEVAGETFVATGRQILTPGWKSLAADAVVHAPVEDPDGDRAARGDENAARLPRLAPGDAVVAVDVHVGAQRTQAPKPFTDATLLAAMCGVAKFVTDPSAKKILTETDGLGTPATRAAIVETLFERGYVVRVGKTIVSTATGRALIARLPDVATTPDRTAVWEAGLRAILEGTQSMDAFLSRVVAELRELVAQGRALGSLAVPTPAASPPPFGPRARRPGAKAPKGPTSKAAAPGRRPTRRARPRSCPS